MSVYSDNQPVRFPLVAFLFHYLSNEPQAMTQQGLKMITLYVQVGGPRPDFRLVLAFVWGDADCDTDGNCRNPADHEWTELYARNRSQEDEVFDISVAIEEPLVVVVKSEKRQRWLASAVAYLLAVCTGGKVSDKPEGPFGPPEDVLSRIGKFDTKSAWERFRASPFQSATPNNPFPNLQGGCS